MPAADPVQAQFVLARLLQLSREAGPFASWDQIAQSGRLRPLPPQSLAEIGAMTVADLALLACREGPAYRLA